jgi:hypothetical protein
MFVSMRLRWEKAHAGLYRGFAASGQELAQVGHVSGPDGSDYGWMVWLTLDQGELLDRHPTAEEAMAAAESALGPDPP